MNTETPRKTKTDEILKAFWKNKTIQNTIEALRQSAEQKSEDYKITLSIKMMRGGIDMSLEEGPDRATMFSKLPTQTEKDRTRPEDELLQEGLRVIIKEYLDRGWVDLSEDFAKRVAEKTSGLIADGVRHELDIAVAKLWEEQKPKKQKGEEGESKG